MESYFFKYCLMKSWLRSASLNILIVVFFKYRHCFHAYHRGGGFVRAKKLLVCDKASQTDAPTTQPEAQSVETGADARTDARSDSRTDARSNTRTNARRTSTRKSQNKK